MVNVKSAFDDDSNNDNFFNDIQAFNSALSVILAWRKFDIFICHGRCNECYEQCDKQCIFDKENENTKLFLLHIVCNTAFYYYAIIAHTVFCGIVYNRRSAESVYVFDILSDSAGIHIYTWIGIVFMCIRNFFA